MGMKDKVGLIYGLIDPRYFELIRYNGETVTTMEARFNRHMTELTGNSHKVNWIKKLLSIGLKPIPILLAYDIPVPFITYLQNDFAKRRFQPFYDYDALDKEERYFISITREECASFGIDCVNGTDGGDGFRGADPWIKGLTKETDERVARLAESVRQSLLGTKDSDETRKNKRDAANKRYENPLEHQKQRESMMGNHNFGDVSGANNPMFGQHQSDSAKEKISRAGKGRHFRLTEEQRLARCGDNNPMSKKNTRRRFLEILYKRMESLQ